VQNGDDESLFRGCVVREASTANVPEIVPILSRGRHRNPRKGACFMEMASYLAGERWSDHPKCTHPLVATVARLVNDNTSDDHRSDLAELIPSVIGLKTADPRADARIALCCATAALPIASAKRQNVMAVSVLAAERALAALDGREPGDLDSRSLAVLDRAPHASAWAREFAGRFRTSADEFHRFAAPQIARMAVQAIAEAAVPDPDERLHDLLAAVISECATMNGSVAEPAMTASDISAHTLESLN
jgi:hypothetical protein